MGNASPCCNGATEIVAANADVKVQQPTLKTGLPDAFTPAAIAARPEDSRETSIAPEVQKITDAPALVVKEPVPEVVEEPPAPKLELAQREQPEPVKVESPQMEVEFFIGTLGLSPDGISTGVNFRRRPLGMTFANTTPISVEKVKDGGHAEELGVQPGWVFKSIAGRPVEGMSWDAVADALQGAAAPLEGPVVVEFLDEDGVATSVNFVKRPLGLKFRSTIPVEVESVVPEGHADQLGVLQGWKFKKISGRPVDSMDWNALTAHFQTQTSSLPIQR